ncbi:MAG: DUF4062 domain-containing protein [Bacteroidia bacterium]|nr:DUF4062 domain-containing protein [Bacteroidia bacterium]
MNKRKFQVFISSTYKYMQDERQNAVEAILLSGNIPAGMELFAANNTSQIETIKNWIQESDIFLLLLGSRYGTIESRSNVSYIEMEFNYAKQLKKEMFCLITSDEYNDSRRKLFGDDYSETSNLEKYLQFKEKARKGRIVRFCNDLKDIKLYILESLYSFNNKDISGGWIQYSESIQNAELMRRNILLSEEIERLELKVERLHSQKPIELSLEEWLNLLNERKGKLAKIPYSSHKYGLKVNDPNKDYSENEYFDISLLNFLKFNGEFFLNGESNRLDSDEEAICQFLITLKILKRMDNEKRMANEKPKSANNYLFTDIGHNLYLKLISNYNHT